MVKVSSVSGELDVYLVPVAADRYDIGLLARRDSADARLEPEQRRC